VPASDVVYISSEQWST